MRRSLHSRSLRTATALVLVALAAAPALEAQIIRPQARSTEPRWFGSLGAGFADPATVEDGETQSRWEFDAGFVFRATLEYALTRGASLGIAGSYGRFPLDYAGLAGGPGICVPDCEADADILTGQALFRLGGGGLGLHQVIEVQAGLTNFRNFEAEGGGSLPPSSGETDFSFSAGYGVGYGFSRALSFALVQEFGALRHGSEGVPDGGSDWVRTSVLRASVRYGVGTLGLF